MKERLAAITGWLKQNAVWHLHKEEDLFGTIYCVSINLYVGKLHIGFERER